MDTDDLSEEAYKAIIVNSELFHHNLTLQFGVLSSSCDDENEYLEQSLFMIEDWVSDIEIAVNDIFYENIPLISKFRSVLIELKNSIIEVQKIPIDKRTYEVW